jgi:ubiquinone/menaquinone biosynthesis C-methylase UbiE
MLMLSELVGEKGSVTGVDVSEHRMNVTRNVLRKYNAQRVRLFLTTGEDFNVLAPVRERQFL